MRRRAVPWMETQWLPVSLVVWITALAGTLDARQQVRFVALCTGLLFARGRRTVASWLRLWRAGATTSAITTCWQRRTQKALAIAGALLRILLKRLAGHDPGTPLVFGIDDSPTKRYGPHVEGAGKHHNPTPGPAGSKFLYGHVWVCLARLVRHRSGGRWPCRSSRTCTSGPRISAGWRRTTAGSSAPSWSWPPPRSSGWSSSWARTTRRSEW